MPGRADKAGEFTLFELPLAAAASIGPGQSAVRHPYGISLMLSSQGARNGILCRSRETEQGIVDIIHRTAH